MDAVSLPNPHPRTPLPKVWPFISFTDLGNLDGSRPCPQGRRKALRAARNKKKLRRKQGRH